MLKKILEKPEEYRKKVALITTGIIGIIIFAIWLFITQYQIKESIIPGQVTIKSDNKAFEENLPSLKEEKTIQETQLKKTTNN